jgi:transcriptional regulator with XRE-family HTH domain
METKSSNHTSISEMLRASGGSPALIEAYKDKVEETRLIKRLIEMRQNRSKTQKDISAALGCTQSRISKIESGVDADLTIGYLQQYAAALQFKLVMTFVAKEAPAVDRIKYHALQIEQNLAALAQLANDGDSSLTGSIGNFFGESLYNLVAIVARQARKLPPDVGFDVQVLEGAQNHPVSRRKTPQMAQELSSCMT